MPPQRVAIIGLGLIGASLGLALHQAWPRVTVVGHDRSSEATRGAARRRAVDRVAGSADDAVRDAELVVLATPVRAVESLLTEIAPALAPGAIVTDTGSTKAAVVAAAAATAPDVAFVGGHPMAGRLTHGSDDVDGALFRGTVYCLTPTENTPPDAVARVVEVIEGIGARPHFLGAEEHDGLVAAVSHLPYLLSTTLMTATSGAAGWREMAELAAGGFATMTRLADGEPEMYADICLTNRDAILHQIDRFADELATVRAAIADGDASLRARFGEARGRHQAWLQEREGARPSALASDELRAANPFLPQRWQDALRGRRPSKSD